MKVRAPIALTALAASMLSTVYAEDTPNTVPTTTDTIKQSLKTDQSQFNKHITSLAPGNSSALQHRLKQEEAANKTLFGISFDKPTYILPAYYTASPDNNIGPTPDNQPVMNLEFKAQMSFKFPLWHHILHSKKWSLYASYTQLNYWQVYAKSQYFRETNYEPAVFVSYQYLPNLLISTGAVHQSNGRGGTYERSWNRIYANFALSGKQWLLNIEPWILIFKPQSSDLHNKDITHFMGHGDVVFAYKLYDQEVSFMIRNVVESGFARGTEEIDYSFPLHGHIMGYLQYFHGYGQSLIEYNHKTNAGGIGIALSNWI
jgi:phospholipase A1/A2